MARHKTARARARLSQVIEVRGELREATVLSASQSNVEIGISEAPPLLISTCAPRARPRPRAARARRIRRSRPSAPHAHPGAHTPCQVGCGFVKILMTGPALGGFSSIEANRTFAC